MRTATLTLLSLLCLGACTNEKDDTGGEDDAGEVGGGVGGEGSGGEGSGGEGSGGEGSGGDEDPSVSGTVTGPYSPDPNPSAVVYAWNEDDSLEVETDDEGQYEVTLTPGTWWLEPSDYECYGDSVEVELALGDRLSVDLEIIDCITADKPNLYLYPPAPVAMQVELELDRRQRVVASDPPYRADAGWRGTALPDGTFAVRGPLDRRVAAPAPFLFYEVSLAPWQARSLPRTEGWCVEGSDPAVAAETMAEILGEYGFNARERLDFVEAWEHDLPPAAAYAVWPLTEVDHLAGVAMDPPLPLSRLWLVVDDGDRCPIMAPPAVVPFDRSGGHAVEWGVILDDIVR